MPTNGNQSIELPAIVVGSSRGIGRAVALGLAEAGRPVVVNGRFTDRVDAVVDEIVLAGGRAVGVVGSAADERVATALVDTCVHEFGGLGALINCAGTAEPFGSTIATLTSQQWQEQLDSHLNSTFHTCRAAAAYMVDNGGGSIVNTSSPAFLGDFGGTGYPAAKGAVVSLTLALAAELAGSHVRVNAVCPGARTRLSTGPEYEEHIRSLHERGILDEASRDESLDPASPQYVSPLYVYLAGSSCTTTGSVFLAAGSYIGRYVLRKQKLLAYRDHRSTPPWTDAELTHIFDTTSEVST